jgi:hypothetical protein
MLLTIRVYHWKGGKCYCLMPGINGIRSNELRIGFQLSRRSYQGRARIAHECDQFDFGSFLGRLQGCLSVRVLGGGA